MKLRSIGILAAALAFAAAPAFAGEDCSYGTQECLDYMATKMKDSGWVGVELEGSEDHDGMTVTSVVDGSPAEEAGIQTGDVLVAINGIELSEENQEKLNENRKTWKPGSKVVWSMARDDAERELNITLARMPADVLARYVGKHMLEHADVELASSE